MNVSFKQLKAFVTVASTGSVAEAAETLHLSQPALSTAIKNMEESISGSLFNRTSRKLILTPEGQAFLPTAERLLRDWETAFADLHDLFTLQRGKLCIAAMPSMAATRLPEALSVFRQRYAGINIEVLDIVMEKVLDAVSSGRADLGITFEPDEPPGLDFQPLFSDRFMAVIPPDHVLTKRRRTSWQQLAQHPYIAMNRGSATRGWTDRVLQVQAPDYEVRCEAGQLVTIGRMVAEGLGVSAVPSLCREQMEEVGAVCRPLVEPTVSRNVGVFTRRRHSISAVASEMLKVLVELWGKSR